MTYLLGSGWWVLWYGLLWVSMAAFGAGYYAATPKLPMANRWAAQLICLTSAAALVFFCVHATWRFRHR